jgi:hypothetical protein
MCADKRKKKSVKSAWKIHIRIRIHIDPEHTLTTRSHCSLLISFMNIYYQFFLFVCSPHNFKHKKMLCVHVNSCKIYLQHFCSSVVKNAFEKCLLKKSTGNRQHKRTIERHRSRLGDAKMRIWTKMLETCY